MNRPEFKKLLTSLRKLNDSAIFRVKPDGIHALGVSADRSIYLWGCLGGEYPDDLVLNISSLSKLSKLLDMISSEEECTLKVNTNNLEYKGNGLKFKYHLQEDGVITDPKLTPEKIKTLDFSVEFEVDSSFIDGLRKKAALSRAKKLYIYPEDGRINWFLGDKSVDNSDNLTIIGEEIDEEFEPYIITVATLQSIELPPTSIKFRISKIGLANIVFPFGDLMLNYILSSHQN